VDEANKPFQGSRAGVLGRPSSRCEANSGAAWLGMGNMVPIAEFEATLYSANLYKALEPTIVRELLFSPPVRRSIIPKQTVALALGIPDGSRSHRSRRSPGRYAGAVSLESVLFHADSYGYMARRSAIDAVPPSRQPLLAV